MSMIAEAQPSEHQLDNQDPPVYINSRIEDLPCYHAALTRNASELLLLGTEEGTFLLRPSSTGGYSASVRLANSVRHFQIDYNDQYYMFGHALFWSPRQLWTHLMGSPVLECDEGVVAHLIQPYHNEFNQTSTLPPSQYAVVKRHHQSVKLQRSEHSLTHIVSSKEGPLYKKKQGKKWKRRWFILHKNCLSFKKSANEKRPIRNLDLNTAIQVEEYHESSKENCFRVVFPKISYYLSADSPEEMAEWLGLIKWQVENGQQRFSSAT